MWGHCKRWFLESRPYVEFLLKSKPIIALKPQTCSRLEFRNVKCPKLGSEQSRRSYLVRWKIQIRPLTSFILWFSFGWSRSCIISTWPKVPYFGLGKYIFPVQVTSKSQIAMISENETKSSAIKNALSAEALRIIEAAKCQDEVQGAVVRRPTSNYMGF